MEKPPKFDAMKNEKKGMVLCLISAFCYALGPIIGKSLFHIGLPWRVAATVRGLIPAVLILFCAIFFARNVFRIEKRHLKWFILNSVSFSLISFCNYCAIFYINASVATVLLYTLPVFTVILSRFMLKEKFTVPKVIATVLVFLGVVCIINLNNAEAIAARPDLYLFGVPSVFVGIFVGLLGGLFSAFYTIFTRKLNAVYDGWTVNSWCYFLAFPIFCCIGAEPIVTFQWTPAFVLFVVILSLVNLAAYSLYTLGVHHIDAGKASLLVTLDPVMSVTMSVLILHETLSSVQVVGCVLVASGILFMERGRAFLTKIGFSGG